jgi:hypothetical protein
MVAEIVGFESRAQLGMLAPRSRSRNITPQHGGMAVHWGGPRQNIGTHAQCRRTWLAWQQFHMFAHGWVDIAYSFGFCNHGYIFAGRGWGVRTAAQGTNYGNQNFYAAVWLGGKGNGITERAFNALEWIILETRKVGAGTAVRGHNHFTGSECAGSILNKRANILHNKSIHTTEPLDSLEEYYMSLPAEDRKRLDNLIRWEPSLTHLVDGMVREDRDFVRGFARSARTSFRVTEGGKERWPTPEELGTALGDLLAHATQTGKSSVQGAVVGGLNAFLYIRDVIKPRDKDGNPISTTKRFVPSTSSPELKQE